MRFIRLVGVAMVLFIVGSCSARSTETSGTATSSSPASIKAIPSPPASIEDTPSSRRTAVVLTTAGAGSSSVPAFASTSAPAVIYRSANFEVPVTIALDPQPRFTLDEDSRNLLTWTSYYNSNNRVRLMIPVEYYPAGVGPARPAPRDYVAYFKSLKMVTYTDLKTVDVDGETGTIMTADVMEGGLDGSIGCPVVGADQADVCFGFGPELTIRLAVLRHNNHTILVWARTNATLVDRSFLAQFETMLHSIRWR